MPMLPDFTHHSDPLQSSGLPSLDQCFSALSDPTRRRLLETLKERDHTVSELAEPLPMSLPAVQKHLRVLEDAGLVVTEKRGRTRHCHLQANPMATVAKYLGDYREFWSGREERRDGETRGPLESMLSTHLR